MMMGSERFEQQLPASLREQLRAVRRSLWWVETCTVVLGIVGLVVLSYLTLFLCDRFWETPGWLRLMLGWAVVAGGVLLGLWWLRRRTWARRDARQLAILVQRAFPRLGDRLQGVIELADPASRPPNVSAELCRAAMEQVASEASGMEFRRAVPSGGVRRLAVVVGAMALVAVGLSLWLPAAARNVWQRLVWPLAPIERFTLTRLAELPARQVVAFGESFSVTFRLSEESYWRPKHAQVSWEGRRPTRVTADATGVFRLEWPGATRSGLMRIEVGDTRGEVTIVPMHRPELAELLAVVEWPAYIGASPVTQDMRSAKLRVLEGSMVDVLARLNRAVTTVESGNEALWHERDRFGWRWGPVTEPRRWEVTWSDEFGLRARELLTVELVPQPDNAPTVDFRGLRDGVAILEDEVLNFEVVARDDHGVKEIEWKWYAAGDEKLGVVPTNGTVRAGTGGPQQRELVSAGRFAPRALGLGPQLVVLQAHAVDFKPGRETSASPVYRILIVDRLEHARWMQREMEQLLEKLEEIARLQEALLEQNRELRERLEEAGASGELAAAQRAQEENAARMLELADRTRELLQEALRNPLVAEDVLRQWSELAQRLARLGQHTMRGASEALRQAGEAEERQEREELMEQAMSAQRAALAEMMEALQGLNRAQDQLTAGNFVARLRAAAQQEFSVAGELTRLMPETIGLRPEQLAPGLKLRMDRLAEAQRRNQKAVRYLRDDLGGFAQRTRDARAGGVHEAMMQTRVVEELEKLSQRIEANVGGQAIEEANQWARRLEQWAEELAPSAGAGGGGGGGGGGSEMTPEMLALLLKLTRARLVEEGLRDNTRFLDEMKDNRKQYEESAARLAKIQGALADDVEKLLDPTYPPELLALLGRVVEAMRDAEELLARPETGIETIAAQTEVIELLTASSRQASGGQSSSGSLAMLMQMLMGGGGGAMGGGNPGTSGFDGTAGSVDGRVGGATGDPRTVERATGRDVSRYPAEFREVLERYFEAVEEVAP
ncbi:MAG: hypothetical protein RMM51_05575 [Verrucomicrobiae bacterium]|nr:hypothetical protein [Verrucomicrobiae bacterium]